MELTQTEIAAYKKTDRMLAGVLLDTFMRANRAIRTGWRSIVGRVGKKRKGLAVLESATIGDRRFVSVIQFERRRFLIGSSPSSITLLSQLPDATVSENSGTEDWIKNRDRN